jgi:thioredoxin reductase
MVDLNRRFDVLVAGGGNAALCAAISAALAGRGTSNNTGTVLGDWLNPGSTRPAIPRNVTP